MNPTHDENDCWPEGERALNGFEQHEGNAAWLDEARAYAKAYLKQHPGSTLTAEQVVEAIGLSEDMTSNNVIGGIFRTRDFRKVDRFISEKHKAHVRVAYTWALA